MAAGAQHRHAYRPSLSVHQVCDWRDTRSGGERQPSDGIMLRHDEDILKGAETLLRGKITMSDITAKFENEFANSKALHFIRKSIVRHTFYLWESIATRF